MCIICELSRPLWTTSCTHCGTLLIAGVDELHEVNVKGCMSPLCEKCFKLWDNEQFANVVFIELKRKAEEKPKPPAAA